MTLRSGLVAWALAMRFSFTCCVADDLSGLLTDAQRLVITSWMLNWLVTISCQCCSWGLQSERCFSSAVVEKHMSSFKLIRILLLQWLFACCFSGAADLGWGRVLRTPTSPFALKGECHKSLNSRAEGIRSRCPGFGPQQVMIVCRQLKLFHKEIWKKNIDPENKIRGYLQL